MFKLTKNYSIGTIEDRYDVISYEDLTFVCDKGFITRGTTLLFIPEGLIIGKNKLLSLLQGEHYRYSLKARRVVSREVSPGIISDAIVVKWTDLQHNFFRGKKLSNLVDTDVFWELNKMLDWNHYFPVAGFQELIEKGYTTAKRKRLPERASCGSRDKFKVQFNLKNGNVECFLGKRLYRGHAFLKKRSWLQKFLDFFCLTKKPRNVFYPTVSDTAVRAMKTIDIFTNVLTGDPFCCAYTAICATLHHTDVCISTTEQNPIRYSKLTILHILKDLLLNKTIY